MFLCGQGTCTYEPGIADFKVGGRGVCGQAKLVCAWTTWDLIVTKSSDATKGDLAPINAKLANTH